jgi:fibronectin-binding autotransporter adhesin
MKFNQLLARIVLSFSTTLLITQSSHAQTPDSWTSSVGGNWSVAGNWSSGVPGTTSDVKFGNVGVNMINTNAVSSTIDSLFYNQDNGGQQTTVINPGQTLTIDGTNIAAGAAMLYVGSTTPATTASTLVPVAIQGIGGTLVMTNSTGATPGDIWVAQGNGTAGSHMATLDMSGLGTFIANVGRLYVGVNINGINRPTGHLLLAQTNIITCTSTTIPQVEVQESGVNGNGSTLTTLSFGQNNQLYADTMRFGGDKANGNVDFAAAAGSAPTLKIRNADGVSPCTVIDFGYNDYVSSGNSTVNVSDFSAGIVDISANLVHIAQGNPGTGSGSCTATVTLGGGTLNVPDLEIGYGNAAGANSGGTTGTLLLDNTQFTPVGSVVICSTVLNLARTNGPVSTINGTLTIGNDSLPGDWVYANTITSGGGVSTINLYVGNLVVSNTIGSLSLPIRYFNIGAYGGGTLTLPLSNLGAAVTVSNLNASGANVINISALPSIGGYPVTLPIISYKTGTTGNSFTLGSLPAGGYVGTLVDNNDGVVSLHLTAGPTSDLNETWSGTISGDWDFSTYNWLFHAAQTNFFNSAVVFFDDTSTQTDVSLDTALAPNSVTVNNSIEPYTFAGGGNITAGTLTKSGSSSLTLDNSGGVNNISSVVINGGTLQVGAGDANGGIASANITDNGALVVDRTDSVTLGSDIAGSGTLTQGGGGTLILSGANTYSGATSLTNGTLEIDQTSSGTSPVTTSAGTVLSGDGLVNGPVTVGGQFSPGNSTALGGFQAAGGLTLSPGSTLNMTLDPSSQAGSVVTVIGNLAVNNNTVRVNFQGIPSIGDQYVLFNAYATTGSFNPSVTGTHYAVALDSTSTPGFVYLNVTGSSGYALEWNSDGDGTWDTLTTNWNNLGNSTPSTFASGDSVQFDEHDYNVNPSIIIPAGVTVYPATITVNSDVIGFNIGGSGQIGGAGSIVKSGASTLALATANSFTGTVDIQGGTLQTENGGALANATVTVENGATLDFDGQNVGGMVVDASGSGVGGIGAIINSGGGIAPQTIRAITLLGDTTFGGSGGWEMNNSGGTASLTGAFNLTKVGANTVTIQNLTTVDAGLGNIDIQAGTLLFSGITPGMGDATKTVTVESGATLAFGSDSVTWLKNFVFNGDGTTVNLNNEGGANNIMAGPITLNGNCVFTDGGVQLIISNTISGSGGLIKSGTAPLILDGTTGPNTYTGDTSVSAGTLQLVNGASISTSKNIILYSATTLDMGGTGLTLGSGQSISGNGTVTNSSLVAGAGSTVSPGRIVTPGVEAIGNLTVKGAITLSGTNIMDLDPANNTNDVLTSSSTIAYGGTLILTNLSTVPTNGSSFKLYKATSYSGSFNSIVPATPGAGLAWNTSALTSSGTVSVVSTVVPMPHFVSVKLVGTSLVMSGTNGTAGGSYYVLTSTNVAAPLASWQPVATNSFSGTGTFNFTNSVNSSEPQRFYLLKLP